MDKRCGTCSHFYMGQRGYCTWKSPIKLPTSYQPMNMWIDHGKDCETWESVE